MVLSPPANPVHLVGEREFAPGRNPGRHVRRVEPRVTSYNFAVVPTVASRHPLWEGRLREGREGSSLHSGPALSHGKEALATTFLDAEPDAILKMPEDFADAVSRHDRDERILHCAVDEIGWLAIAAALVIFLSLLVWLWPERRLGQRAGAAA